MKFSRAIRNLFILGIVLGAWPTTAWSAATFMSVDVLSLTLPARSLTDLNSLQFTRSSGLIHMPFYFRINYSGVENLNWGIQFYSNNKRVLGEVTTPDGLLRGMRSTMDVSQSIPLYFQVYNEDQNVAAFIGTPVSVTSTVSGLGFYPNTLHYWETVYDRADIDHGASNEMWDNNLSVRTIASVDGLAEFPQAGRTSISSPVYLYLGGDLPVLGTAQRFTGLLTFVLFNYPQDYNRGCYATPNPVKPVQGARVYFNFYTTYPYSKIVIKIYDPTGFPVCTVKDSRYWDCRNDNGQLVEGGLYLYQIEVEGHVISGTVVVIK